MDFDTVPLSLIQYIHLFLFMFFTEFNKTITVKSSLFITVILSSNDFMYNTVWMKCCPNIPGINEIKLNLRTACLLVHLQKDFEGNILTITVG